MLLFSFLNKCLHKALQDNDISKELGLAASEDAALDALFEKAEKEIISGRSDEKNLVGICTTFLSKLCRNLGLMQKVIVLIFFSPSRFPMFFVSSIRHKLVLF